MKRIIKILAVTLMLVIIVGVSSVGYVLIKSTPEDMVACLQTEDAFIFPSSFCKVSLFYLRDSKKDSETLDKHVGLGFVMDKQNVRLSLQLLNHFVDNGANVNQPNPIHGLPPLFAAILSNSPEFCRYMIEHGADTNSVDLIYQKTPRELVQFLKEKEPEVDRSEIEKCLTGL